LQAGRLPVLRIGGERLNDVPVALLQERTETANRAGDGLLPLNLFRSIYINHKRNYVILNPV
jgi:hypothetical protein